MNCCGKARPIYWGGSALPALDATQVQALANSRQQMTERGEYAYEPLSGEYAYLAYPLEFGRRETVLINGLNVFGTREQVVIDGLDYEVHRTPRTVRAVDLVVALR